MAIAPFVAVTIQFDLSGSRVGRTSKDKANYVPGANGHISQEIKAVYIVPSCSPPSMEFANFIILNVQT